MQCPKCQEKKTGVLETRRSKNENNVSYRRRKCLSCGYRFTSYEFLATSLREVDDLIEALKKENKYLKACQGLDSDELDFIKQRGAA